MQKALRKHIVQILWEQYRHTTLQMKLIEACLNKKGIQKLILDHFAIIDLPGPHTGIRHLSEIFLSLGYVEQGRDYLADKQNDFLWMTESDSFESNPYDVLPQVVVADFRMDELPLEIKKIIEKYAKKASSSPVPEIQKWLKEARFGNPSALKQISNLITHYFTGRDWPEPSVREFKTVSEFNELLAWVLVFGRKPNHFTLSIHLLNYFRGLSHFHQFILDEVRCELNSDGGIIKGNKAVGIEQGSTTGIREKITLSDGLIDIPTGFVEFVWRHPKKSNFKHPLSWNDFFTGFIAKHADRVIESLY